jgi:hypothetical protein
MFKRRIAIVLLAAYLFCMLLSPGSASAANWFKIQGTEPPDAKTIKVWGFLQPTFYHSESNVPPDEDFRENDFDLRRARFGIRGIIPGSDNKVNYFFLSEWGRNGITEDPNGAQTDLAALTDASVTLNYIKCMHFRMGQFKLPIGYDGLQAIQLHSYIEFSDIYAELLLTRYGTDRSAGAFRDIGAEIFGWYRFGPNQEYEAAYALMVGNGNGINSRDNNDNKQVTGKVTFARIFDNTSGPYRRSIEFGAWYLTGKRTGYTFAVPGPINGVPVTESAKRGGIELVAVKDLGKSGAMHFTGESVWASGWIYAPHFFNGAVPSNLRYFTQNTSVDGHGVPHAGLKAWGGYLDFGYRPPVLEEKVEVDLRYSYYNPDSGDDLPSKVSQDTWTLGLQYMFDMHARLIVNYEVRNNNWDSGIGNLLGVQITAIF